MISRCAVSLAPAWSAAQLSATSSRRTPTWPPRPAPAASRAAAGPDSELRREGASSSTRETADFVTNVWVDYALFAQAVAHGKLPLDSASVAEAVWPEIAELKGTHWHDTLMAHRASISRRGGGQRLQSTDVRVLQHILFGARPNATPTQRDRGQEEGRGHARADQEGRRLRPARGAALRGSRAARPTAASCPPSPKGRFVPAFDSAGWALAAGRRSAAWWRRRSATTSSSGPRWTRRTADSSTTSRSAPARVSTRSTWTAWPRRTRSRS